MPRFIDNTYLHSVAACLRGEAHGDLQVATFLRFLAEILTHEKVLFTGDPTGAVFPITKQAYEHISTLVASDTWLEYSTLSESQFKEITVAAALRLNDDLLALPSQTVVAPADLLPTMDPHRRNPYLELHRYFGKKQWRAMASRYSDPKTSNFAGAVLSRSELREALLRSISLWPSSPEVTSILATIVRMLAYDEFASSCGAIYLPSSGRAELQVLPDLPHPAFLSSKVSVMDPDQRADDMRDVVSALVTAGNGRPIEILRLAWSLRKETAKFRAIFDKLANKGDAMILESQQLTSEYHEIVSSLLGKNKRPLFVSIFDKVSFTFGIPSVTINTNQLSEWIRYKRRAGHVRGFARLLYRFDKSRANSMFDELKQRSTRNPK